MTISRVGTPDTQNEQLLAIFNTVSDAMLSVSSGGAIRLYNAALLSLIDTNQSLAGMAVDDVLRLYDQHNEQVSLFELLKKCTSHLERDDLVYRIGDDDDIRLLISASQVYGTYASSDSNGNRGYIVTLRDITRAKSLEEERDEFISVVSHELRTPVAISEGSLSNVQLFLERGASPEALIPSVKEAHEQIMLLSNMINDLSTLSRAERGVGDTLEVIELLPLAEELYKKYQPAAAKKGLQLNLDAPGKPGAVQTSRLYLEEILQNFITNAIKYTPSGSVTLQIHRNDDLVTFAVSDTGIGISTGDTKHIFEKFYRSEDYRTRETNGTGLGLYVVHKLAHKLHIKIEIESQLNHGSTFSFVLPAHTK